MMDKGSALQLNCCEYQYLAPCPRAINTQVWGVNMAQAQDQ